MGGREVIRLAKLLGFYALALVINGAFFGVDDHAFAFLLAFFFVWNDEQD